MGLKADKDSKADERRRRLAAELRSNLAKRKQQARARATEERAPAHQGGEKPTDQRG